MVEQVGVSVDSGASSTASVNTDAAAAESPAEADRLARIRSIEDWLQRPAESRPPSIKRCIQCLMHACQCFNASCDMAGCRKMKWVMAHTRSCRRRTSGGCLVCKQLIALCCYHSKRCLQTKCGVPFCTTIKYKLRQQRMADAQKMQPKVDIMCQRISRFTCYQWQIHICLLYTSDAADE